MVSPSDEIDASDFDLLNGGVLQDKPKRTNQRATAPDAFSMNIGGKSRKAMAQEQRDQDIEMISELECVDTIRRMIMDGLPIDSITRHIQLVEGELRDVPYEEIRTALCHFRKYTIKPMELVDHHLPAAADVARKRVFAALNDLDELADLYRLQRERIEVDHARELRQGKLLISVRNEILAASEILQARSHIAKEHGLPLGLMQAVEEDANAPPKQLTGIYGEAVAKVLASHESRQRLLSVVQRLSEIQTERDQAVEQGVEEENDEVPEELQEDIVEPYCSDALSSAIEADPDIPLSPIVGG